MNRSTFLKRLGTALGIAIAAPVVVKELMQDKPEEIPTIKMWNLDKGGHVAWYEMQVKNHPYNNLSQRDFYAQYPLTEKECFGKADQL